MALGRKWLLPLALFLSCPAIVTAASSARISVVDDAGLEVAGFSIQPHEQWCLLWNHSVAGFTVRDCFVYDPPRLVLDSSHQPDFAAGLGHVIGRGTMLSDSTGGYRIESINEPMPGNRLRLRVGAPSVDHRIEFQGGSISLSELAGQRVVEIRLVTPIGS
jgi:hypothetical protein